ncbi:MAG: ABC transporter permease subunit [Spirochaetaceae bacterium]|nr:MAG: ABC transporter permease subunit [Spirochaetaceae bacterium]
MCERSARASRRPDVVRLALIIALFGLPVIMLLTSSLSARGAATLTLRAWRYLFAERRTFLTALASSLGYGFSAMVVAFASSVLPAKALARAHGSRIAVVEAILLAPALLPSITFAIGVHQLFIRAGLVDTWIGVLLVLSFVSYPYMLRALIASYESIDPAYEQCARNLGAGALRTFVRVELPFLLPGAVAGGSVVFLVAFSDYFLVFLIGGGIVPAFTSYLVPFIRSADYSIAGALSLVFLLVPVVLFVLQDRALTVLLRRRGMAV